MECYPLAAQTPEAIGKGETLMTNSNEYWPLSFLQFLVSRAKQMYVRSIVVTNPGAMLLTIVAFLQYYMARS